MKQDDDFNSFRPQNCCLTKLGTNDFCRIRGHEAQVNGPQLGPQILHGGAVVMNVTNHLCSLFSKKFRAKKS